jgi:hypothetical protein
MHTCKVHCLLGNCPNLDFSVLTNLTNPYVYKSNGYYNLTPPGLGHQTASYSPFLLANKNFPSLNPTLPSAYPKNKYKDQLFLDLIDCMTFQFSPYNLKFLSTMTFLLAFNVALDVKYFQKVNLSHPLIYLFIFSYFLLKYPTIHQIY